MHKIQSNSHYVYCILYIPQPSSLKFFFFPLMRATTRTPMRVSNIYFMVAQTKAVALVL